MTIGQAFECELNNELDMIKAEIEQITDTMGVSYNQYISKIDVLQIIDKYKTESNKRICMSKEQIKAINDFWKEYTGRKLYKDADNKRTEKHDS